MNELAPLHQADLESLNKSEKSDVSKLIWKTKDGELIPLGSIEDNHLRNIALMLIGMGYQKYNAPDGLKIRWLIAIRMEWEKRMLFRKFNNTNVKETKS